MLTVGITGGTGSGKTTILELLKKEFGENDIGFISQDSYYNDNGNLSFDEKNKINFDHPDAVDFELMINHLNLLKNGKNINQPIYSFIYHNRTKKIKLSTSESWSKECISLPLHPKIKISEVQHVIKTIKEFFAKNGKYNNF